MGWKDKLIQLLEDHRGLVVLLFCLPASFIFDAFLTVKKNISRRLFDRAGPAGHDDRVRRIQRQVAEWARTQPSADDASNSKRQLLCTARPNWLSLSTKFFRKNQCHQVPVDLHDVLTLDVERSCVRVEPMVTVAEITRYLIPRGYTLAVTLEIGDATLGGLAMGTGMTTRSHIAGLYHETILSYEVVLGDGSLLVVTEESHPDLFRALPWSHGSLGFLVALTIQIVPVKPYVKLTYIPVEGMQNYCDKIREVSGALDKSCKVPEYVEATIFSRDRAVVMVGDHSDYDPRYPVNRASLWYKPWFYKHTESMLARAKTTEPYTELIPLRDYLLRHNRAIFWVVESMIPFGNELWFRSVFGWLLPPKPAFLKFTTTPGVREFTFTKQVFQDIVLPISELEKQIETSEQLFDAYPLLVYPCRVYDRGPTSGQLKKPQQKYLVPGTNYAMYNDLGIYGVPGPVKRKEAYNPVDAMRSMEQFTRDVGGFSFLYADIFMTREEFEQMFDLTLYEQVRKKYAAEGAFPHLYDKVRPEIDVFEIGKRLAVN